MATQLQIRRGTSTQVAAFTGAEGEIVVNTTNDSVHVNDGSTAGGFEMARADLNNVSDTSLNAALTGNTVSALTITTLTLGSTAITATGTEINLLDGVTATTAELNYVDGVTSAIQTQIDAKAPLASPTFTGTVTADALTVDTNTLVVDATNNRVGIGTSSPSTKLHVGGTAPGDSIIRQDSTASGTNWEIGERSAGKWQIFEDDTDSVVATFMSSGNVGIGTTSPSATGWGSANPVLQLSGTQPLLSLKDTDSGEFQIANTQQALYFWDSAASSTRMVIDSSGRVGIGTTSPSDTLSVNGAVFSSDKYRLQRSSGSLALNVMEYWDGSGSPLSGNKGDILAIGNQGGDGLALVNSGAERMRIDSSGNVGIGRIPRVMLDVAGEVAIAHNATYGLRFYNQPQNNWSSIGNPETSSSATLVFKAASGEGMRLNGDSNLLVGKTTTAIATAGTFIGVGGNVGLVEITRDGNHPLRLNRTSSDGDLLRFDKDGTQVGSIGTVSDGLYIASPVSSDSGLRFSGSTVHPCTTAGAPRDNAVDLGYAQGRFDDIYATNGTIQTSDRNEKQDIAELTDAEQRVAVAAKGLLRKFRWISSVEENGDDARIHFGIIAQDLQDAFTAEGLDAGRYAMFISSTWTDEDGNEQTRLGVRYSELLAFIIAAI